MSGADNSMSEPRPAASLTGSLLARRGMARPAMRRPSLTALPGAHLPSDDLGWDDMGESSFIDATRDVEALHGLTPERTTIAPIAPTISPPSSGAAPVSPVTEQLQALAAGVGTYPTMHTGPRSGPASLAGTVRKSAFTLRLDADRHLRLRLLSAVSKRSAQQLLVEALDEMVERNARVQELAAQLEIQSTAE